MQAPPKRAGARSQSRAGLEPRSCVGFPRAHGARAMVTVRISDDALALLPCSQWRWADFLSMRRSGVARRASRAKLPRSSRFAADDSIS